MTKNFIIISGRIIRGRQYGRILGFPTANLDRRSYAAKKIKVKLGIYAGRVKKIQNPKSKILRQRRIRLWRKNYRAAIVIGPLDRRGLPKIEAHLIGFNGSLYGQKLELKLIKFIRPFKKYYSEAALKAQIRQDIGKIKKMR